MPATNNRGTASLSAQKNRIIFFSRGKGSRLYGHRPLELSAADAFGQAKAKKERKIEIKGEQALIPKAN
jgi:hypothetical protein